MSEKTSYKLPVDTLRVTVKPKLEAAVFARLQNIYDQISRRAYELFVKRGYLPGREIEDWVTAEREFLRYVPSEIRDCGETLVIRAVVTGYAADQLDITVSAKHILLSSKAAAARKPDGKPASVNGSGGEIYRIIELPVHCDLTKVIAHLKDGVLTFTLAKAAAPQPAHTSTQIA